MSRGFFCSKIYSLLINTCISQVRVFVVPCLSSNHLSFFHVITIMVWKVAYATQLCAGQSRVLVWCPVWDRIKESCMYESMSYLDPNISTIVLWVLHMINVYLSIEKEAISEFIFLQCNYLDMSWSGTALISLNHFPVQSSTEWFLANWSFDPHLYPRLQPLLQTHTEAFITSLGSVPMVLSAPCVPECHKGVLSFHTTWDIHCAPWWQVRQFTV